MTVNNADLAGTPEVGLCQKAAADLRWQTRTLTVYVGVQRHDCSYQGTTMGMRLVGPIEGAAALDNASLWCGHGETGRTSRNRHDCKQLCYSQ